MPEETNTVEHEDFLALLPAQVLLNNVLPFLDAADVVRLASCSRSLHSAATTDEVWKPRCEARGWGPFPRGVSWQAGFSSRRASLCVECGGPSRYVFALLGCRLCEGCEHTSPRYGLVTALEAAERYGVPYAALAGVPYHEACRTRFYLRSTVEAMAKAARGTAARSIEDSSEEEADEEQDEGEEQEEGEPDEDEGDEAGMGGAAHGEQEQGDSDGGGASGDEGNGAAALGSVASERRAAEKAARKAAKKAAKEAQRLKRQQRAPGAGGGGGKTPLAPRGGGGGRGGGSGGGACSGSSPPTGAGLQGRGGQRQSRAAASAAAAAGRQSGGGSRGRRASQAAFGSSPPGTRPAGPLLVAQDDGDGGALPLEGQAVPPGRARLRGGGGGGGAGGGGGGGSGGGGGGRAVKLKSGWAAEREALMAAWGQFGISGLVLAS